MSALVYLAAGILLGVALMIILPPLVYVWVTWRSNK